MLPGISLFKPHKLTDLITIKTASRNKNGFIYKTFNRHTGEIVGMMKARPTTVCNKKRIYFPIEGTFQSFLVEKLFAYKRNCGVGTALINIAKKESVRNFCTGNVHLISSSMYDRANPPHIFYRKQGFDFNEYCKVTAAHIDECIKNGTHVNPKKCRSDVIMHIAKCLENQDKEINRTYEFMVKFPNIFNHYI